MVNYENLMIGNFILEKEIKIDEYLKEDEKVIKIDSIYPDIMNGNFIINGKLCKYYNPISINLYWLERFSFYYMKEYDEWSQIEGGSGRIIRDCYDNGYWEIDNFKIKYVHQLQNLTKF